jgi:hypothetical protein
MIVRGIGSPERPNHLITLFAVRLPSTGLPLAGWS